MKKSYLCTFTILLAMGVVFLAVGLLAPFMAINSAAHDGAMGIIGGASAPTYSYLFWRQFHGFCSAFAFLGGAVVLSSAFALIFRKLVSKTCGLITSLHSLALSVFGSAGLVFALLTLSTSGSDIMRYPYANPTFFVCGLICLFICFGLLISYFIQWYKRASFRGLFLETFLTILYFPGFFMLINVIVHYLWDVLKNFI